MTSSSTSSSRSPTRTSSSSSLSRTETLSLFSLTFACVLILANTFQGDGEPLIASLALSGIAFATSFAMIRWLGPTLMKAGLKGVDMSKTNRREIPECVGGVVAVVYLLVIIVFIPFPFYKDIVAATSGGGNRDVVVVEVLEQVERGRLLHKFPHSKLASYLSAIISLQSITLLGIGDDLFDIRWRHKFFIPAFASIPLLVVYFVDFGVTSIVVPIPLQPYLGELVNVGALYYVYMASVAIFSPNSINILAGINGIEVSQSIVIALLLAINDCLYLLTPYPHPATDSHLFSLYFLLPFLGVSLALLWHNWYPARVFVGDTYCYFAGMVFVVVSILGHFSKTLILLLIPQIFNFCYSVPQLFGLVPCPRHRLPRFNARTGLLEPSVTPWTKTRQPKAPIAWGLKVLGTLRLLRVTLDEEGRFFETTNFTILNLWLVWRGPLRENRLALEITVMQTVVGFFGLFVRHGLAQLIFKEDNWTCERAGPCRELGPRGLVHLVEFPTSVGDGHPNSPKARQPSEDGVAPLQHNHAMSARLAAFLNEAPIEDDRLSFEPIIKHGHQDLVQSIAFNDYGDRCATGSVDGKIRVFNRHKDGVWRHCDNWTAHGGEITELQWLPPTIYPNLLASLGIEGRFKLWAEDPSAAPGSSTPGGPHGHHHGGMSSTLSTTTSAASHPNENSSSAMTSAVGTPSVHNETAPSQPPTTSSTPKPVFETRNSRSPYRSFSMKHIDSTRHTYLALVSADGKLTVYENEQPENLTDYTMLDEVVISRTTPPAARGEETTFKVQFDPNPEVCYSALRAGMPSDTLSLVTVAVDCVRIYRSRDVISQSLGVQTVTKGFYLAVEVPMGVHRGLVRDVAWAGGNIRGYDVIATACQDGMVRVFRVDTPVEVQAWYTKNDDRDDEQQEGRGWSRREMGGYVEKARKQGVEVDEGRSAAVRAAARDVVTTFGVVTPVVHGVGTDEPQRGGAGQGQGGVIRAGLATETMTEMTTTAAGGMYAGHHHHGYGAEQQANTNPERRITGLPGQIRHAVREVSRLEGHRTPVWRVGFDDDGVVLGSVGDEGGLMQWRMMPNGEWAKSSELGIVRVRMATG
ncbi:glycosyl transferase family 4-domain-containing protein [Triangularia setosa]|uniref:UDP-N-acetylglucosamine--dolichyl-phosphate N-acetylglucosaminephosphotransferase n=1 Tax=Triangularia setosa TaxID=2587417 RepID=A0AAN6W6C8_9PEZI|nr:glycosyl transferase family 4-domain-containing protein [Podospora setosa]